jgi:hypothetical protein
MSAEGNYMNTPKITAAQNKLVVEALCKLATETHRDLIDLTRFELVKSIAEVNKQTTFSLLNILRRYL